jgi:hypothetical protein
MVMDVIERAAFSSVLAQDPLQDSFAQLPETQIFEGRVTINVVDTKQIISSSAEAIGS